MATAPRGPRAPPRPAPARPAPPRAAKGRAGPARGRLRLWLALLPRRWLAVAVIVAVLLVGIPLAHALVGDLGALLLLTGVGCFALGRATASHALPGRPRPPARRKG